MNTEKLNSIKQIREVLTVVNNTIPSLPIGSDERNKLEKAAGQLEALIWNLVQKDLKDILDELKLSQTNFQEIADDLRKAHTELNSVGNRIEKVSQVLGALINITSISSSSGLL